MKEIEINKNNWNARVKIHRLSKIIYNIDEFKKGKPSFVADEHHELMQYVDVKGKSLLHLQCHFGLDTMSWTRLGAEATGVDFSEEAIQLANEITTELGLPTEFIESDIYDLNLNRQFDIVFTSIGVLPWLPNLREWAKIIANHLKKDGIFYLKDTHPIYYAMQMENNKIYLKNDYFNKGKAVEYIEKWTYAHDGTDKPLDEPLHYEWDHTFSEIINAICDVGLHIFRIEESPFGFYKMFESMRRDENGRWFIPGREVPLTFTLFARKLEL